MQWSSFRTSRSRLDAVRTCTAVAQAITTSPSRLPRWSARVAAGLLGASIACAAVAQGAWTRIAPAGEALSPRSAPVAAAIGSQVFVFGGVKDDFSTGQYTFFNDLHHFDANTRRWSLLSPTGAAPAPRALAAAVSVEHRRQVVVFGGVSYTSDLSSIVTFDDLWSYDTLRNRWTQLRSATAGPIGRAGPAMWQVGDQIFVFGGATSSQQALNDLWAFDLRTSRWTQVTANGAAGSPVARFEGYTGTDARMGKLTIFGGITGADTGFVSKNDTWQFDLRSRTWAEVTPQSGTNVTPGRSSGAAASLGSSLLIHGGDVPGGSSGCGAGFPQNPTDELWRFDLKRLRWDKLTPGGDAAPRLKRTAAVSVEGRMLVFGGYDFSCPNGVGSGQVWNEAVYSYSPLPHEGLQPRR